MEFAPNNAFKKPLNARGYRKKDNINKRTIITNKFNTYQMNIGRKT